ncbi:hypothetical protein BH11BAC2_BH11BAC2_26600 [soil metagenome]
MPKLEKGWLNPFSSRKKFISTSLSYGLSKLIDSKKFVAVSESYVDVHDLNSEQPDVVIYDVKNDFSPCMIIECSEHSDLQLTLNSMEIISNIYHVPEAFVYDLDQHSWYKVGSSSQKTDSRNNLLGCDLELALNQSLLRYY